MFRACAIIATVLLMARPVSAAPSIIYTQPQNNIEQLGYPTNYMVQNVPQGLNYSTVWDWQQNDADCVSNWTAGWNQGMPSSFNFGHPGTFVIRCTVTYDSGAQDVCTRTVTIPTPTITAVMGTGVKTNFGDPTMPQPNSTTSNGQPGCWVTFKLSPMGPQLDSIGVQEKLTNIVFNGSPQADQDWTPPSGTTDWRLAFIEAVDGSFEVIDWKYAQVNPNPTGNFASYTQEIRLTWGTLCGNAASGSCGKVNFSFTGYANPNQWTITSP